MTDARRRATDELTSINQLARTGNSSGLIDKAKDANLSGPLRAWAIRKLVALGDPGAIDVLIQGAGDPDLDVRLAAARGMGNFRVESAAPVLLRLLQTDPSPIVRAWAARSLAMLRVTSATPALVAAVGAESWQLRCAAAAALATLGAADAEPVIADAVRRERSLVRKWRLRRELKRV